MASGVSTTTISVSPIVASTGNSANPRSGLGNPNASAWSLVMIEPLERTGLMLQVENAPEGCGLERSIHVPAKFP